ERELRSLLSVETDPTDARITLKQGDRVIASGTSPFAETLEPGDYDIAVEHPDYRTVSRRMRIRPGKVYVAILEMSQGEFLGYLRVVTNPPGARIYIDDREQGSLGETPFQNVLSTGEHTVWIERPGYETVERTVEVELGETHVEELTLERTMFGKIRVVANVPGAVVLVDGEEVGEVPYEGEVDAGERRVTVRAPGMKDWREDVEVPRGQLVPLRIELERRPSRSAGWATLTLGLASAGAGIALGILGSNLEDELDADLQAGRLASGDDRFMRARIFNWAADGAFGVAAVFGLLSLYYFVRDPLPPSSGRVLEPRDWALVPSFDLNGRGAGGALRVSF
ncbi:MAG: PEGA domain-containing protein, partial [Myxococcota bacterium]